jgi:hypothetical protein
MAANGRAYARAARDLHEIRERPAFPSLTVECMQMPRVAIAFGTAVVDAAFFASWSDG